MNLFINKFHDIFYRFKVLDNMGGSNEFEEAGVTES